MSFPRFGGWDAAGISEEDDEVEGAEEAFGPLTPLSPIVALFALTFVLGFVTVPSFLVSWIFLFRFRVCLFLSLGDQSFTC